MAIFHRKGHFINCRLKRVADKVMELYNSRTGAKANNDYYDSSDPSKLPEDLAYDDRFFQPVSLTKSVIKVGSYEFIGS